MRWAWSTLPSSTGDAHTADGEQLDDLLTGVGVALSDEVLDRIDAIVPPGTSVGRLDMAYQPPALQQPLLRRRPLAERSAAA